MMKGWNLFQPFFFANPCLEPAQLIFRQAVMNQDAVITISLVSLFKYIYHMYDSC